MWKDIAATAGIALGAVILLRAVEDIFPMTQKLTKLPQIIAGKLKA